MNIEFSICFLQDPLTYTLTGDASCIDTFRIESSIYNFGSLYINKNLTSTTGNFFVSSFLVHSFVQCGPYMLLVS